MPQANQPFPDLQIWNISGLSFPWADYTPQMISSGDMTFGPDGASIGMVMMIFWRDLYTACQELLGYSWRDTNATPISLNRKLPWQHPLFNQMWVRRIASVKGGRLVGNEINGDVDFVLAPVFEAGGAGTGYIPDIGPATQYMIALLTIEFWRPPYAIRTDDDIIGSKLTAGNVELFYQQEWLRYTSKEWTQSSKILSQQGMFYVRAPGQGTASDGKPLDASAGGKVVTHAKITRRWYEVPEACIFKFTPDGTPNGLAFNFLYTQTPTVNPITQYIYQPDQPICGTVNTPIGGQFAQGALADNFPDERFFGCFIGTLLFEAVELIVRPLQLPAWLMKLPVFDGNEPISQTQYDVVFHFDLFDPPRSDFVVANFPGFRGHNCKPWPGDGMFYALQTQEAIEGSAFKATPYHYADFTDLFTVL